MVAFQPSLFKIITEIQLRLSQVNLVLNSDGKTDYTIFTKILVA